MKKAKVIRGTRTNKSSDVEQAELTAVLKHSGYVGGDGKVHPMFLQAGKDRWMKNPGLAEFEEAVGNFKFATLNPTVISPDGEFIVNPPQGRRPHRRKSQKQVAPSQHAGTRSRE